MPESESRPPPPETTRADVTRLLVAWRDGNEEALGALMPLVYDELRRLAHHSLGGEAPGHTLQTTALVHEAFVRMVGADIDWQDAGHFKSVAASAMRRVLVDHARKRNSKKRGSGDADLWLDSLEDVLPAAARPEALLDLDEALERLFALDERKGRAVELYYFGGLSYDEVAAATDVSPATVHRDLRMARAWLYSELADGDDDED